MAFVFEKLEKKHTLLLFAWLDKPHVKKWWPVVEKDEKIEDFLKRIRSKDTFGYMVKLDEKLIGYIQYYYVDRTNEKTGSWLPELPKTTIGTDQFIGDSNYLHKGHGTRFIKEFIKYLSTIEPQVSTIIVDPDPTNLAAIRCYEKVGFKKMDVYSAPWGPAFLMRYDFSN